MAISSVPAPRKRSFIKRILPRSLFGRLVLIILSPLILLQVISTWVFYDRHYETVTRRLAQGLSGDIAAVIQMMIRNPGSVDRLQTFRLAERVMLLKLTFEEGARLEATTRTDSFGIFASVLDRQLAKALREIVDRPFLIDTHSLEKEVQIDVQLADGVLRVLAPRKRLFSSTTYIFIMWMVGSSIVLFVVALLFMRNQVKSIRRLAQAADSFGKGRDVADFKPEGATEVRQVAGAFIQMRDRIKRQIRQRTEILAGVSHDLRTPLTRMKLQLAMLGRTPETENLESDVAAMERMVEGYLAFARGESVEQPEPTEVSGLLREVVVQMRRDGGIVDLHVEQAMTVPLRREPMRRCLSNLIANAQRYGEHVSVRAGPRDKVIEITIDDDGPGIPPDKRKEVFKPFFRIEGSRNPETGGVGLGLTIARDVARNHGGDIVLEDAPGGGLRARIWLPV
ncbi:MAG: HAMP domain-containing protein [Proteobacteria bacterium]|nr:HAMP domain-containing protein [Pseudomonadota bacterium]